MQQRLTIVGLGVADLTTSNDFYENKFGWTKLPSSNENITFMQLNGILLSLYPKDKLAEDAGVSPEGSGFNSFTLAHNVESKEAVDEIFEELEQKEVTIVKPPQEVFWGGYSGYVADPDGHLWEIAFNPYLPLDESGNVK